jgi:hypothetical protein
MNIRPDTSVFNKKTKAVYLIYVTILLSDSDDDDDDDLQRK